MAVSFNSFPANWRMPLYWAEVDPSQAGQPIIRQPALLVAQMLASGVAVPDVPIPIGTLAQAKKQFGEGSMLERAFASFFKGNFAQEVWALPLEEPSTGAVATMTLTFAGTATDSGTVPLYIAGQLVNIGVNVGDTAAEIAAAAAAAINLVTTLPVHAIQTAEAVALTCRWKGSTGNDIDVRDCYAGAYGGEELPPGVTISYGTGGKLTGGTGAPTFATPVANLGEQQFEYVALPFTDSTSLAAWETEYGFGDTGRWGWMRQLYGHLVSARRGTFSELMIWGATRNSGVTSVMGVEAAALSPVWEWAAAYDAKAARGLTNDAARPLQTLQLEGIVPAPAHQRFSLTELNDFSGAGIATQQVGSNGVPMIMRETTTYQLNLYGQSDDAYELMTTLATLAKLLRNQRAAITSKFPRMKLANDGTRFGQGQAIVTPKSIKAELVAQARADESNGLVENAQAFKDHLIVERDPNNPNRVNVLYPPDLVNQLRIFAVLAQFRLQYDRGIDPITAT
jgi:phage tail sheath gpL-like